MNYIEVCFNFAVKDKNLWVIDLFKNELLDIGFESFVDENKGFCGYVPQNVFSICDLEKCIFCFYNEYPDLTIITYNYKKIEQKNWNEKWEKEYDSVIIDDFCVVRPPFNSAIEGVKYDIVIEPKMSFGTAHHPTTVLMLRFLQFFDNDNTPKSLMDMGCGTAVLAILAKKMGVSVVWAVDNDEWAIENAVENAKRNKSNIFITHLNQWIPEQYDVFLANINRNTLLENMKTYCQCVKADGKLILSGFYNDDCDVLIDAARTCRMQFLRKDTCNDWAILMFQKIYLPLLL